MPEKPTILVTGGAGYIGSHVVIALQRHNYNVVVLDNRVCGHRDLVEEVLKVDLVVGDIGDRPRCDRLFATYNIAAVMHFAACTHISESVQNPGQRHRYSTGLRVKILMARWRDGCI